MVRGEASNAKRGQGHRYLVLSVPLASPERLILRPNQGTVHVPCLVSSLPVFLGVVYVVGFMLVFNT